MSIAQQLAVVTGAGSGMGQAIAERLARDGARVALLDLDADRAEAVAAGIREAGGEAAGYAADVSDATALDDAGHHRRCSDDDLRHHVCDRNDAARKQMTEGTGLIAPQAKMT